MKITFHGAAGTVTGSQHLIEVNDYRILLDSGLFQGKRKEAFEQNRQTPFDPKTIDALVLSHAHIDHSGNIPTLIRRGFQGDILCTAATRDLCAAMLVDSAHIQQRDVEYVNRKRKSQGKNLFEPLYTHQDAIKSLDYFMGTAYGRQRQILPGVYLTLVDAGHMLGSSSVILDIEDQEAGRDVRVVFSGDIGRPGISIIRDPQPITAGTDVLIMESTYGSRLHRPVTQAEDQLAQIVNETVSNNGTLLIPAFAVGRTQQLVFALHKLFDRGVIPNVPVFVDSPLATNVTSIFQLHPEAYDEEISQFMLSDTHRNPFGFDTLTYTRSVDESKELNTRHEPCIIISASGMMENGRILHHLRHRIEDPRTTILAAGFQAYNTLGRRIVDGADTVRIFGEEYQLKARVESLHGFSGHADRAGLLEWAGAMEKQPSHTFLVHGEPESTLALAEGLQSELGFANIKRPQMHESFEVTL